MNADVIADYPRLKTTESLADDFLQFCFNGRYYHGRNIVPMNFGPLTEIDSIAVERLLRLQVSQLGTSMSDLRNARVIDMLYPVTGKRLTLNAIGEKVGLSSERVRQLKYFVFQRLCHPSRRLRVFRVVEFLNLQNEIRRIQNGEL